MKELLDRDKGLSERDFIEVTQQQKKQQEYTLQKTIRPFKGHKVYEIRLSDLLIREAEKLTINTQVTWLQAQQIVKQDEKARGEYIVKKGYEYISALNPATALERLKQNKGSASLPIETDKL